MKKEKCQHQLFDYEADYVICPACGEPIPENMPADPNFKLQVIRRSRKYKAVLKWKAAYLVLFLVLILIAWYYPDLEESIIRMYHISGIDTFEPTPSMYFYPFQEVTYAVLFVTPIFAGPSAGRRKWLSRWHLQKYAHYYLASYWYPLIRVASYILLIYLGNTLWSKIIYVEEMEQLKNYLGGQELIYASMVYAKENLRGLYIVLGINFLADCWLFFYQRLAIRVNRF